MRAVVGRSDARMLKAGSSAFTRPRHSRGAILLTLICCDCAAIVGGFLLAHLLVGGAAPPFDAALLSLALYAALSLVNAPASGEIWRTDELGLRLSLLAWALCGAAVIQMALAPPPRTTGSAFLVCACLALLLLAIVRPLVSDWVRRHLAALMCNAILIRDELAVAAPAGFRTVNAHAMQLAPGIGDPLMLHVLGALLSDADRVVVACPPERRRQWSAVLKAFNVRGELLAPELGDWRPIRAGEFSGMCTLPVSLGRLSLPQRAAKRLLDLVGAAMLLVMLAPLFLGIFVAIRRDGPGPYIFSQTRMGRGNRLFRMYKFRSMRAEACDDRGSASAVRHDQRVTRSGRTMRSRSLDELPQLVNVLLGQMSLVGRRPHALGSLAGKHLFWEVDSGYWHRHAVKPGMTGLAQIRGHRGPTANAEDLARRLRADIEYLDGWTIWRDLLILAATFRVLRHPNAF